VEAEAVPLSTIESHAPLSFTAAAPCHGWGVWALVYTAIFCVYENQRARRNGERWRLRSGRDIQDDNKVERGAARGCGVHHDIAEVRPRRETARLAVNGIRDASRLRVR
jgi:hypothetical protein